jgi:hypothetical protein
MPNKRQIRLTPADYPTADEFEMGLIQFDIALTGVLHEPLHQPHR